MIPEAVNLESSFCIGGRPPARGPQAHVDIGQRLAGLGVNNAPSQGASHRNEDLEWFLIVAVEFHDVLPEQVARPHDVENELVVHGNRIQPEPPNRIRHRLQWSTGSPLELFSHEDPGALDRQAGLELERPPLEPDGLLQANPVPPIREDPLDHRRESDPLHECELESVARLQVLQKQLPCVQRQRRLSVLIGRRGLGGAIEQFLVVMRQQSDRGAWNRAPPPVGHGDQELVGSELLIRSFTFQFGPDHVRWGGGLGLWRLRCQTVHRCGPLVSGILDRFGPNREADQRDDEGDAQRPPESWLAQPT